MLNHGGHGGPLRPGALRTTNRQILGRLERNFSRVFLGAHASGVHVVAVGSAFARWKRALPGIRAAPGPCGEIFGCGWAAPCRELPRILRSKGSGIPMRIWGVHIANAYQIPG